MIPPEPQRKLYLERNLHVIFSVTLVAVMGVSSLTPAFPKIAEALQISSKQIGLLITVFTLPGVILTPPLGVLADRWGRKRILIPALFLFGIAGTAGAFVRDFELLLIFRFFQGIGAASLGSLNVTLIGDLFTGKDRPTAMGYNASVLSVGTAGYPAIGGALAMLGWHYPFALASMAVPVAFFVLFSLKNPEPKSEQHLSEYFQEAWQSLRRRQVVGLFIASIAIFIILYGSILTYFPFLLKHRFNASPLIIGLMMATMSVATAITSSQLGRLARHFSEKVLIRLAFCLYGIALLLMIPMPNLFLLLIPTTIFGVAQGMNIPSIQTLLASFAPIEHRAIFMSLNGMVLRIGQTLGPVIMAAVFAFGGMDAVFYTGAGLAFAMSVWLALIIR